MLFAMSQLPQPIGLRRVLAAGGRAVNVSAIDPPHARHFKVIDIDAVFPERLFKAFPSRRLAQARKPAAEPIITKLHGIDGLSSETGQPRLISRPPLLNFIFGVVGLRKDENQPSGQPPAPTQSRMRPVITDLPVVGLRYPHLHQYTEQQGESVNSYVRHFGCFVHAPNDTWKNPESSNFICGKLQGLLTHRGEFP